MNAIKSQWRLFSAELMSNDRLRWGIYVIGLILGLYMVLVLSDFIDSMEEKYLQSVETYQQYMELETAEVWGQRLLDQQNLRVKLESTMLRADTEGLGQAKLQAYLTSLAEKAGLFQIKIRMGNMQPIAEFEDVDILRASVRAVYSEDKILDYFSQLERGEQAVSFESVLIKKGKRNNRVELMLKAYVASSDESGS